MLIVMVTETNDGLVEESQVYGGFRTWEAAEVFAEKVRARARRVENETTDDPDRDAKRFSVLVAHVNKPLLRDVYNALDEMTY